MKPDIKDRRSIILSGGRSTEPLIPGLGQKYSFAFLYPPAAERIAASEYAVANLNMLVTPEMQQEAVTEALRLSQRLMNRIDDGTIPLRTHAVMEANGVHAESMIESMSGWLPARMFQAFHRTVLRTKIWEKFHAQFDVAAVVTHEDVCEDTKGMCQFFRGQGVPTIHVPHAVYLNLWRGGPGEDVHDEITCEWIAAAGPFQRDWYIARGADPNHVVLTGLPHWDQWVNKTLDRAWARRALHLEQEKPVVLYVASWTQNTSALGMDVPLEASFRAFMEATKDEAWQAVVKLHPSGGKLNWETHQKIAEQAGGRCAMTGQYLDICLAAADLVVSFGPSNLLIEAAMLGLPGLSVYGYEDDPAIVTCSTEDTGPAITEALTPAWRREFDRLKPAFLEKYAYQVDGKATQRVLELIEWLAG